MERSILLIIFSCSYFYFLGCLNTAPKSASVGFSASLLGMLEILREHKKDGIN